VFVKNGDPAILQKAVQDMVSRDKLLILVSVHHEMDEPSSDLICSSVRPWTRAFCCCCAADDTDLLSGR
jgi:hypothetical protein